MSVQTIAVIGAGMMGTGIAQVAATSGFHVILIDVKQTVLSKAVERIGSGYDRLVAKGQMSPEAKQEALSLIMTGTDHSALATADLVVEAAPKTRSSKETSCKPWIRRCGLMPSSARTRHRSPSPGLPRASPIPAGSLGCTSSIQCR